MKVDVVIIGAGPGGYACAIRCAQVGLRTALVEEKKVGGVCLHWGCIPTKALYAATKLLHQAATAPEMGISFAPPAVDIPALAAWKDRVVETLAGGITTLLTKGGVAIYSARAELEAAHRVRLATGEILEAERIVLATGSAPIEIPGFPFSDPAVWSSDDALALREVPRRLVVIGGGVIGLELANIYRRLGSDVTVVELLPEILATLDLDRRTIAGLKRSLAAQGIRVLTGVKATGIARAKAPMPDEVVVTTEGGEPLHADRILVAVGRRPNSGGIGLDRVGLSPDRRGALAVDAGWRTAVDGIYAIGDLVAGPMLAHKATAEGRIAVEAIAGEPVAFDPRAIPAVVFTDPEIAWCGATETELRRDKHPFKAAKYPWGASGRAATLGRPEGLTKVLAHPDTGRILGVGLAGPGAGELIAEAVLAMEMGANVDDLRLTIHPHPTLSETLMETAEAMFTPAQRQARRPSA